MGTKVFFMACCVMALSVASCGVGGDGQAGNTVGESDAEAVTALRELVIPGPPAMMTDPVDRAVFMAAHYWDNFDFADTT